MRAIGHEKRRLARAFREHGGHYSDVRQVRSAAKGIVDHSDVARAELERLPYSAHGERHRAQVHGHVIAHGHGFAAGVVERAGIIAALFDIG